MADNLCLYAAPGNETHFCGPTAIAAITGLPIAFIEQQVLIYRRNNPPPKRTRTPKGVVVKGMWWSEVLPVMDMLGWRASFAWRAQWRRECVTFAQWRVRYAHGGPYIVNTTRHAIAVSQGKLVDPQNRTPINARDFQHPRARVIGFIRFEPKGDE